MVDNRIIIYDGVCNFCNGSVNFIIKRDPDCLFKFTPMQSAYAQQLLAQYGVTNVGIDTFLLIKNGEYYMWTDAAIEIAKELSGLWYLCKAFKFVPRAVRNSIYRGLARNRYTLFGKRDQCLVPNKELKKRFIGI